MHFFRWVSLSRSFSLSPHSFGTSVTNPCCHSLCPPSLSLQGHAYSILILLGMMQDEFPLKRVHFGAKAEHDSIRNYKIIQQFFLSKGISKSVCSLPVSAQCDARH